MKPEELSTSYLVQMKHWVIGRLDNPISRDSVKRHNVCLSQINEELESRPSQEIMLEFETFTKPIPIPKRNTGYKDIPYFSGSKNELRRQIKLN